MFTPTSAVAGLSGLKQKTKEDGYRLELRKSMSDSLTGFLQYASSKREGDSPWLKPTPGGLANGARGVIEANDDPSCVPPPAPALNNCIYNRTGIFPNVFEDRERDKVKFMVSWMPSDTVSVQFLAEDGKDKFTGPTTKGISEAGMSIYSLDATFRVSEDWNLTGYASTGDSTYNVAHSSAYMVKVKDTNVAFGASLKGKVSDRMRLTADLTYTSDKVKYPQELDQAASAANIAYLAVHRRPAGRHLQADALRDHGRLRPEQAVGDPRPARLREVGLQRVDVAVERQLVPVLRQHDGLRQGEPERDLGGRELRVSLVARLRDDRPGVASGRCRTGRAGHAGPSYCGRRPRASMRRIPDRMPAR